MKKYGYICIALSTVIHHMNTINEYGAQGWRLVAVLGNGEWAYFEREIL